MFLTLQPLERRTVIPVGGCTAQLLEEYNHASQTDGGGGRPCCVIRDNRYGGNQGGGIGLLPVLQVTPMPKGAPTRSAPRLGKDIDMKTSLAIIGAIAIVGSAHAGAEQAAQPENQRVVTLKVSGMQCHLCAGTVERTAKKLTGVVAVMADQPKGVAEITYDATKTSPDEIAKLLTRHSGFKTELPKQRK